MPRRILSWSSEGDIVVLVGTIMSSIFVAVGLIGSFAFTPRLLEYWDSAHWTPVPAIVRSAGISTYRATSRPNVRFEYEYQGQRFQSESYDALNVYTSNYQWVLSTVEDLRQNPQRQALVNPRNPRRAILTRGLRGDLVLLVVPPFFTALGLIAGILVAIRWRWLALGQPRHGWFGRSVTTAGGAAAAFFSNQTVLTAIFFTGFLGVTITLAVIAWITENWLLLAVGVIMLIGLYRAMQKPKDSSG